MSNAAEDEFVVWAGSQGWTATKRGWPDFICLRGDEVMAVEVKWSDGLRLDQQRACLMLAAHGIPTYVWSPPGPLEPFELVPGSVDFAAVQDEYWLALENERLRAEVARLRSDRADLRLSAQTALSEAHDEIDRMQKDLGYLLRLAEWHPHRTNRLRDIFRRYPNELLSIRPKTRRRGRIDVPIDVNAASSSGREVA